jgi:MraZ protein
VFIGEYLHSIDEKGRLAIPFRFRKFLKEGAVVAKGLVDKSLSVYPKEEWAKLAAKLTSLPISDSKARAFTRLIFSGATEVSFDRQGRILLPGYLRKYANLKTQAMIVGVYTRIEIWDEKTWNQYKQKSEKETPGLAKHMEELGI